MINLLRTEVLRLLSSGALRGFGLLALVLVCWPAITTVEGAEPVSEADWVQARVSYESVVEQQQFELEMAQEQCGDGDEDSCQIVADMQAQPPLTVEEFLRVPTDFTSVVDRTIRVMGVLSQLLVFAFLSQHVGSQFSTGEVGTQLTFTPNRRQVMWAKIIVATVAAAAMTALWFVLGLTMDVLAYSWVRGPEGVVGHIGMGAVVGRYLLSTLLAAALAATLALLFASPWRGPVFMFFVFAGTQLLPLSVRSGPVLSAIVPLPYVEALVEGEYIEFMEFSSDGPSVPVLELTFWHGLAYCLIVLALLIAITSFRFSRRDILK